MAILNEVIGVQGFEKVTYRIAEILKEEISNQQDLQDFDDDVEVYLERMQPFQRSEDVIIEVHFKQAEYEGYTTKNSQGEYLYFIDLYATGVTIGDKDGSVVVAEKLNRYLGLIRYILSSGKLLTLGFPLGLIGGKYIKKIVQDNEFANFGAEPSTDACFMRFARVFFVVRLQENQELWDSIPLLGNNTNITYEDSELGTKLVFND